MMSDNFEMDFFGDAMRIFMGYIERQHKKDPNYKPHPIIRAFECAFIKIDEVPIGNCTMGVSQNGTDKLAYQPYAVVLQKNVDGIEVKELLDMKLDKTVPLHILIYIFRLQIKLDTINSDTITPRQMVDIFNEVMPRKKFILVSDQWEEARDLFREDIINTRISIPRDESLKQELLSLRSDTPWEEYSPILRSLIAVNYAQHRTEESGMVAISALKDTQLEKYKVFGMASEYMMGQTAEYMKPFEETKKS